MSLQASRSSDDGRVTWFGLVRKNLLRRPVRTLLTSAGVAIGVGLIVALLSILAGVERTAGDLIHIGRADFGLFQSGVSDATRSLLPVALQPKLAADPGVAATAWVFLLVANVQGQQSSLVFGLAPHEFPAERTLLAGSRAGPLVGDAAASSFHVRPGSTLRVDGRPFRVSGIFHSGDRFEDTAVLHSRPSRRWRSGRPRSRRSPARSSSGSGRPWLRAASSGASGFRQSSSPARVVSIRRRKDAAGRSCCRLIGGFGGGAKALGSFVAVERRAACGDRASDRGG